MNSQYISFRRALTLLCDGQPHDLKYWKKNGEIVELHEVVRIGGSRAEGNVLIKVLRSRQKRLLIEVNIFEIDGLEILL